MAIWRSAAMSGLLTIALTACASKTATAPAAGPSECFEAAQVSNYAVQDRDTVNLRVNNSAYYQLKLLGVCPAIKWTQGVGLKTQGSNQVCTGLDVTIVTPTSSGPQECAADSLRRLTPDQVAALPPGAKP